MGAFFSVVYGLVVYAFFLATFLYTIGFIGNVFVPKSIDTGAPAPLAEAVIVNLLLLGLFAVQHSVMARRSFKAGGRASCHRRWSAAPSCSPRVCSRAAAVAVAADS